MQIINWSCRSQLLTGQEHIVLVENDFQKKYTSIFAQFVILNIKWIICVWALSAR
jgi:hypothetical protein